ncbi:hypothetical protein [Streptomyces sp. JNUCC 63]
MKIYVTSRSRPTLDLWSSTLPRPRDVELEFVDENERSVQADVLVMSGVWAFDRYGGKPEREVAQLLPNTREDGLPQWIVVPPFRPVVERNGKVVVREDFASVSPAYHAILESLRCIRREFGDAVSVTLHLPLLGMDDPDDGSTVQSVGRAISQFLAEHGMS